MSTFVSGLLGRERAAHVVAVQLGQVAVEDDHVVGHDARLVERRRAVPGDVDRHALAAQPARDGTGDPWFVLGDQHPHGGIMVGGAMKRRSTLMRT